MDPEAITSLADLETPQSGTPADAAFIDALPDSFAGLKLHGFSDVRVFAAQALGNRVLSGRVNPEEIGIYDGLMVDVVMHMWVITAPRSAVMRAARQPVHGFDVAMAWAEEIGLDPASDLWPEALDIYMRNLAALASSRFASQSAQKSRTPSQSGNE